MAVGKAPAFEHAIVAELTPDNFDYQTAGKIVFINFQAPWSDQCKSLKPAWDKLMQNWNKGDRFKWSLIADVDCTSDTGKPICERIGVKAFPTIKWGEAGNMKDYDGGHDYDALREFAKHNLKPQCGPANIDLCDAAGKKEIEDIQKLSPASLSYQIEGFTSSVRAMEMFYKEEVEEIQAEKAKLDKDSDGAKMQKLEQRFEEAKKTKDETIDKLRKSGLSMMLAVQGHQARSSQQERRKGKGKKEKGSQQEL